MPRKVKAVDLLVDRIVPPDLRDMLKTYSAKELNNFLLALSERYPDKYSEISHKLAQTGLNVTYLQGDSLGLEDLDPVVDKEHLFKQMDLEISELEKDYRNDPEEFQKRRENVWMKYNDLMLKQTAKAADKKYNAMGMAVASGSRGKPQQVQAMLSSPGLYQDANGSVIPLFVRNSFIEGLRPIEFMAGTYGARSSVVSTKRATAQGGDIGKLMSQAVGHLIITSKDCKVQNGIKYDLDDPTVPGRVLVKDMGSLRAGTILDRNALSILKKEGIKNVVARSPMTCKADGLCAKCVGIMNDSRELPKIGDHVGITASTALAEPLTQGALSCLHEGTLVRMADWTTKPIEDIRVGDMVLGADKDARTFPVVVTQLHNQGLQPVYRYKFRMWTTKRFAYLESTPCHKILANKKNSGRIYHDKYAAEKLPVGTKHANFCAVMANVAVAGGEGAVHEVFYRAKRTGEAEYLGMLPCYDISVDHPDELFVLHNSLIVSNSKHTAGQAKSKQGYGGLDIVSQFVQSPEEYQHRATVAGMSGKVEQITPAPQGGTLIRVGGVDHYAPQGYDPMVKVGDDVDEGDQLSEGLMDVRDVVRHKGLGAGRKYYVERLGQIYNDSGLTQHPKNLEIVARGALNTVTMDDFLDGMDTLPDDVVDYNKAVKAWTPENEKPTAPDDNARNKYLSRDTLHYTVGTKLNRQQLKDISDAGITEIYTVDEKPPFTSNMDRLRVASHYNDDWLASMSSSYLKKQLGESAYRGGETNVAENQHWAPRIAYGKGFGETVRETGKF